MSRIIVFRYSKAYTFRIDGSMCSFVRRIIPSKLSDTTHTNNIHQVCYHNNTHIAKAAFYFSAILLIIQLIETNIRRSFSIYSAPKPHKTSRKMVKRVTKAVAVINGDVKGVIHFEQPVSGDLYGDDD